MFTIHTKEGCKYCKMAKELLTKQGKAYNQILYKTDEEIAEFKARGFQTFPQIYDGDKHIGGYDALTEYLEKDDF